MQFDLHNELATTPGFLWHLLHWTPYDVLLIHSRTHYSVHQEPMLRGKERSCQGSTVLSSPAGPPLHGCQEGVPCHSAQDLGPFDWFANLPHHLRNILLSAISILLNLLFLDNKINMFLYYYEFHFGVYSYGVEFTWVVFLFVLG